MPKKTAGIEKAKGALESKKETLQQVSDLLDKSERLPKEFNKLMSNLRKKNVMGVMSAAIAIIRILGEEPDKKEKEKKEEALKGAKTEAATTTAAISGLKDKVEKRRGKEVEKAKKAREVKIAPQAFKLDELKHPDPNKKHKDQDKDALVGYLRSEKSGWTLCSKTAIENVMNLVSLSGADQKEIVRIGKPNHIKIILDLLNGRSKLDELPKGKLSEIDQIFMTLSLTEIKERLEDGSLTLENLIPRGNANMVESFYQGANRERHYYVPPTSKTIDYLNASGRTLCDIITSGSTEYGHRAAGIKAADGKWYVIDPYSSLSNGSTTPIPFENYAARLNSGSKPRPIKFVVPINTSKTPSLNVG